MWLIHILHLSQSSRDCAQKPHLEWQNAYTFLCISHYLPYRQKNFVRARAYRVFPDLVCRDQPRGHPSGPAAPSDVPSVDPSTLGRKTLYALASLKYCYNPGIASLCRISDMIYEFLKNSHYRIKFWLSSTPLKARKNVLSWDFQSSLKTEQYCTTFRYSTA